MVSRNRSPEHKGKLACKAELKMKLSAKVIKPSLNEIELRLEICFSRSFDKRLRELARVQETVHAPH